MSLKIVTRNGMKNTSYILRWSFTQPPLHQRDTMMAVHIVGLPSSDTKRWWEKKTGRRGCVRHNQCLASWHWQPSPLALLLHKEGRARFFFNCTTEDAPPSTPSKGGYQEGFIREWNKKRNPASFSAFLSDDQNFQKRKEEICQKCWEPEVLRLLLT